MHLFDGARGGPLQRYITFPIVRVYIHHDALHRRRGIVAGLPGGATVGLRDYDAAAIGVEEDFGGIKAPAVGRIGRSATR